MFYDDMGSIDIHALRAKRLRPALFFQFSTFPLQLPQGKGNLVLFNG